MNHMLHILGLACLTAAAPAQGTTDTTATREVEASSEVDTSATPAPSQTASGLRVVLDPETGEIVDEPTAAQLERLAERQIVTKRRPAEELRTFTLPGGGEGVFLDGWADHALEVKITADGEMVTECPQGDRHAGPETGENDR